MLFGSALLLRRSQLFSVRSWKKYLTLSDLITSRGCRSMDPIHLGRRSETCASDMSDMSNMLSSDILRSTAFNGHIEHIVFDLLDS